MSGTAFEGGGVERFPAAVDTYESNGSVSFVSRESLDEALARLHGTAGHLLKIWLVLKHMGLAESSPPVAIDTANSTGSLKRLFGSGDADGSFYVPFSHTSRYSTMREDASRSIIQTNIQRWGTSQSVVGCDPTGYLDIRDREGIGLSVGCGRSYPLGLGYGGDGFALSDDARVAVPLESFAIWYGRQTPIPDGVDALEFLTVEMKADLHLTPAEEALVFQADKIHLVTARQPLTDQEVLQAVSRYINGDVPRTTEVLPEEYATYVRRVRAMTDRLDQPAWLRINPEEETSRLLDSGANAVLLYGPPRTGKTRYIDRRIPRTSPARTTIQIHDGWSYDHLIQGFTPDERGEWVWKSGAFKQAIDDGRTFIVMEEVNRTEFSQALGEVFSLIEQAYRGEDNAITLRNGERFFIPQNVTIVMTMNTVDKSTEEVDDALLGRMACVEFPPSVTSLVEMLADNGVPDNERTKLAQVYSAILQIYPLGHGYFADLSGDLDPQDVLLHYRSRIRPVLVNFLGELRIEDLQPVENLLDELYGDS